MQLVQHNTTHDVNKLLLLLKYFRGHKVISQQPLTMVPHHMLVKSGLCLLKGLDQKLI